MRMRLLEMETAFSFPKNEYDAPLLAVSFTIASEKDDAFVNCNNRWEERNFDEIRFGLATMTTRHNMSQPVIIVKVLFLQKFEEIIASNTVLNGNPEL
jgi:hypothetical protein